jgi:DNA repair exonuclease SbcCD ATPase subunit
MKSIVLNKLSLHDFKGVKDFEIEPDGDSIKVRGQNATGKTTLFDAFTWLLFGKSSDDKQLSPKPIDDNGNEILGAEPLVEATLTVDGEELRLIRNLKESWSKPRGQLEKVRKSDVTELYVNDVPKKVGEYQTFINDVVDEDTFKLLTNPFAFNSLKWNKQREVLMGLVANLSDEEIAEKTGAGDELKKMLGEHPLDEQRKIISAQMKKIKQDIDGLPARIDENKRGLPDLHNIDKEALETQLAAKNSELESAQMAVTLAGNSDGSTELRMQVVKLKNDIEAKRSGFNMGNQLGLSTLSDDLNNMRIKASSLKNDVQLLTRDGSQLETRIATTRDYWEKLKEDYKTVAKQEFDENELICPTCGQQFAEDKAEELKSKFNQQKSEKIEKITADGFAAKDEIQKLADELEQTSKKRASKQEEFQQAESKVQDLNNEFNQQKQSQPLFEDSKVFKDLNKQITKLTDQIENAAGDNQEAINHARKVAETIQQEINEIQSQLVLFTDSERINKRVEELEALDGQYKQTYSDLERKSFVLEEFVKTKVNILESEINQKFALVSFKLFETQKNGGLKETCEATVDGVPFSKGLNNAARINAGLDIINTLSKTYEIEAPIFVDNAESVNELIDTEAQKIELIVSEDQEMVVA